MKTQSFADPTRWAEAVLKHVGDTGHTTLLWADNPHQQTYGIACDCGATFRVGADAIGTLLPSHPLRKSLKTQAGKKLLLRQMIEKGLKRQKPVNRSSVWDRLTGDDEIG